MTVAKLELILCQRSSRCSWGVAPTDKDMHGQKYAPTDKHTNRYARRVSIRSSDIDCVFDYPLRLSNDTWSVSILTCMTRRQNGASTSPNSMDKLKETKGPKARTEPYWQAGERTQNWRFADMCDSLQKFPRVPTKRRVA